MEPDQHKDRSNRLAPVAQAGLAALVAGSLLAFSALAFRTGFNDGPGAGVTAAAPRNAAQPLVLPDVPVDRGSARKVAATDVRIEVVPTTGTVVPGQRITKHAPKLVSVTPRSQLRSNEAKDTDHKRNGKGHEKARGNGHHKERDESEWTGSVTEAREDDDDSWDDDDHDSDDSDDSDESHEGSGGHSHGDSEDD